MIIYIKKIFFALIVSRFFKNKLGFVILLGVHNIFAVKLTDAKLFKWRLLGI